MSLYTITVGFEGIAEVDVEADNEEDAIASALESIDEGGALDEFQFDITDSWIESVDGEDD